MTDSLPEPPADWAELFEQRLAQSLAVARHHHWELRQRMDEGQYVSLRHWAIARVLHWARSGELSPDWREHQMPALLVAIRPDTADQAFDDHSALINAELAALHTQPWEPHATGGDWKDALDAWFTDALANETYLETSRPPRGLLDMPAEMLTGLDTDAIAHLQRQQDEQRRQHREQEEKFQRGQAESRAMLGASYRAGLAAGGEPIDWRGWLESQLGRTLRHDAYHWYQSLPHYWTEKRP